MEITISSAQPEDTRGIQEVYHKTWLATYPNKEIGITVEDIEDSYKDAFTDETLRKRKERIINRPENERQIIAKVGTLIVGVCMVARNKDNNKLQTIYVLPEFQGKGIGKMLWNEVMKFADQSKDTIVQVTTYNQQAISFYEKLGFKDTGKRFSEERFRMKSGAILPEMEMILKTKTG